VRDAAACHGAGPGPKRPGTLAARNNFAHYTGAVREAHEKADSNARKEAICRVNELRRRQGLPAAYSKVGRNAPCPCGSGRKYKFCHGDPRNRPDN
jgi:uncharacterized protein YecA (UPF0149 family)